MYTKQEKEGLDKIHNKITQLKDIFIKENDKEYLSSSDWYLFLKQIKNTVRNYYNDLSYIACLMAKEYLLRKHTDIIINIAKKSQSAPGLDFDIQTKEGIRIIAELKTTDPYKENDFGAQQRVSLMKDFKKLRDEDALFKYFFVTEKKTFDLLNSKYKPELKDVTLVLLGEQFEEIHIL